MDLSDLIAGLKVRTVSGTAPAKVRVCDITDDSRTAVTGSLFVARAGLQSDGRKFIPDALKSGAVAVLTDDPAVRLPSQGAALLISDDLPLVAAEMAERFYGTPTARLALIGITGTNGKTTTAHLVHQVLNGAGVRCGLIGTVLIDDGREVSRADMTTPPAIELSRTFATMVENGCKAAAMEVSSHALDQGRVAALRFDIGVFTNLTGDHLDYHKTMEAYGAAKAKLFEMLPGDGFAIVNAEDAYAERMVSGCRAKVLRCVVADVDAPAPALKPGECRAAIREMSMSGTRVEFAGPWGSFETTMRLVGRHNAMNALQAVAAAHAAGVDAAQLEQRIRIASAPPGRLEPVTSPASPFAVLVDYAHTDDALRKVLTTLRPLVEAGGRGPGACALCLDAGATGTGPSGRGWARRRRSWRTWCSSPATTRARSGRATSSMRSCVGCRANCGRRSRWMQTGRWRLGGRLRRQRRGT